MVSCRKVAPALRLSRLPRRGSSSVAGLAEAGSRNASQPHHRHLRRSRARRRELQVHILSRAALEGSLAWQPAGRLDSLTSFLICFSVISSIGGIAGIMLGQLRQAQLRGTCAVAAVWCTFGVDQWSDHFRKWSSSLVPCGRISQRLVKQWGDHFQKWSSSSR